MSRRMSPAGPIILVAHAPAACFAKFSCNSAWAAEPKEMIDWGVADVDLGHPARGCRRCSVRRRRSSGTISPFRLGQDHRGDLLRYRPGAAWSSFLCWLATMVSDIHIPPGFAGFHTPSRLQPIARPPCIIDIPCRLRPSQQHPFGPRREILFQVGQQRLVIGTGAGRFRGCGHEARRISPRHRGPPSVVRPDRELAPRRSGSRGFLFDGADHPGGPTALEDGRRGAFHVAGPPARPTWSDMAAR